ncbi:M48 family metallopeptidase [Candidatus Bathyarchaeota archaeon]|nr:M48 family metallopeptidase [Candidatus Bathyarchaeota archaeon]MBL7080794.1 M48 family metallopeptidase [Candidatus Bathyarchaeota archaeon]
MDSEVFTIGVYLHHFHHQKGFHYKLETLIPDHRQREKQLQRYTAIPTNIQYTR